NELSGEQYASALKFIEEMPGDPAAREDLLGYLERWRLDYRQLMARGQPIWSVFFHADEPPAIYWAHAIILAVFVLFTLGVCTRVTSALAFLGALSSVHRHSAVPLGMDTMQTILLFYLMVGPSGAALSVDRLVARYRALRARPAGAAGWEVPGPEPSVLANFVLRLVQIHFCFIYLASGLAKLKGPAWWEHTAIWYTVANPEFSPTNWGIYNYALQFVTSHRPLFALG